MKIAFTASDLDTAKPAESQLVIQAPPLGDLDFELLAGDTIPGEVGSLKRADHPNGLTVFAKELPIDFPRLAEDSLSIFESLFDALGALKLYRMWTYIPKINEGEGDSENYRRFCIGRSQAYEKQYHEQSESVMASGTCVGCHGDKLFVIAIAGEAAPQHFENPRQVPAYRYPRRYGPRSPSFARGTAVDLGNIHYRFISGTASVLGHESIGVGDLQKQLSVTCQNLDAMVASTAPKRAPLETLSQGKVYLRDPSYFPEAQAFLRERFPDWEPTLVYLHSDICRKDLMLEIELTLTDRFKKL